MKTNILHRAAALSAIAIATGAVTPAALGSAWTRPDGNLLILLPTSYTHADESFDSSGDRVDRADEFTMVEFSPLIEYGVSDSFTLGMQPKYRKVWIESAEGMTDSNSGLAESDFFARQRLWGRNEASLALQVGVKVPISPDEDARVALGRDQYDGEIKLAYGNRHTLGNGRIFYSGETGYTKRWEVPADEAFFNAFIGWAPGGSSWSFILRSANTVSVGNDGDDEQEVLTTFPDYNRHAVQLMTSYRFSNSLSLVGGVSTTYAGENVGIGQTGFLALTVPYTF
jgi:hypothetical protein